MLSIKPRVVGEIGFAKPIKIEVYVKVIMISCFFERMADHAVDIGE